MSLINHGLYRFDDFELQPSRRALLRRGEKIAIAPKTFEVLFCLTQNAGRVVLKEDLLKTVWPESFVEESNLTQHIFWLRKALADRADYIVTIPGRGYEFIGKVEIVPEPDTNAAQPPAASELPRPAFRVQHNTELTRVVVEETSTLATTPVAAAPSRRRFWFLLAATSVAVLAAAAFAGWRWAHRAVPGDHHEVVLADFENTTGDPGFDHALKTLLAIDLNQSSFLNVAADTATNRVLKLMNQDPGQGLTPVLAREVCQRMNDQVVLGGVLARFGNQYLVTLTASDCATGKDLVSTKAVSKDRDGVLTAVDSIAADMRQRLGEPMRGIQRPTQPLQLAHTFSLDALRAYSQGTTLQTAGKLPDAVPFYQRAIELDPKFVAAYANLATCYRNMGEGDLSDAAFTKAYALRDLADDSLRFSIVYYNDSEVIGDKHQAVRDLEAWSQMFPSQPSPLNNLADLQGQMGHPDLAIDPAKRALDLDPTNSSTWQILARVQMQAGQFEEAKATCTEAFRRKIDAQKLHEILFNIAFFQHDSAALQQQISWAAGKKAEPEMTVLQARAALAEGKASQAIALWQRAIDIYTKLGVPERGVRLGLLLPRQETQYGLLEEARQLIKATDPTLAKGYIDFTIALVEVGQVDRAEADLNHTLQEYPHDTALQEFAKPWVQGDIALARHKPEEAIAALEAGRYSEMHNFDIPMMRARAYLASNQAGLAAAEFRKITQHPGVDPVSSQLPLAHLGLARAFQMQGDHAAGRHEYDAVFALWKDADANLPPLKQARAEYASLTP